MGIAMRVPMRTLAGGLLLLLAAPLAAAPSAAPFLWRITVGDTTHHLQGSVHLLPATAHPLPAAMEAAYAGARGLVFESDIAALSAPELQKNLLAAARAPAGLAAELPRPLHARLQRYTAAQGLPEGLCEPFRAWFCALSLEMQAYARAGFAAELGLDQHYYTRALKDDKDLAWLEEPQAHLDLFMRLPARLGPELLQQVLEEAEDVTRSPERIYQAWRDGDAAVLEEELRLMQRHYPGLHARLLSDRNRAWLPALRRLLRGGEPQLIVVGAAHLPGPDGLVALLRAEGFRVEAVAP